MPNQKGLFNSTHWSVILAVRDRDPNRALQALETLCADYWYPLYSYLRRHGHSPQDAEDLIQGFFGNLLSHDALERCSQTRGRFRTFLLACLEKFVIDRHRWENRQKRGGRQFHSSVNADQVETRYAREMKEQETPQETYERIWAIAVIEKVLNRLRAEAGARGQSEVMKQLEGFLMGDARSLDHAQIAQRLGISEGAVKMISRRLRLRFRQLFHEEIQQTVEHPDEAEDEIKYLFQVLSR